MRDFGAHVINLAVLIAAQVPDPTTSIPHNILHSRRVSSGTEDTDAALRSTALDAPATALGGVLFGKTAVLHFRVVTGV